MPVYDYVCPNCKTIEERMVKRAEDIQFCDKCNTELTKQISSPCFILKGVGVTSNGSFRKSKEGPKIDKDLLRLSDAELDRELGYDKVLSPT